MRREFKKKLFPFPTCKVSKVIFSVRNVGLLKILAYGLIRPSKTYLIFVLNLVKHEIDAYVRRGRKKMQLI